MEIEAILEKLDHIRTTICVAFGFMYGFYIFGILILKDILKELKKTQK